MGHYDNFFFMRKMVTFFCFDHFPIKEDNHNPAVNIEMLACFVSWLSRHSDMFHLDKSLLMPAAAAVPQSQLPENKEALDRKFLASIL